MENQEALDRFVGAWTANRGKFDIQRQLRAAKVPCSAVQKPEERVERDPDTKGLWPLVTHTEMGDVRVDGIPARFSKTPWRIERPGPCLGEHNEEVFERLLGLSVADVAQLRAEKVV
jgi:crotonobetainyl-CoA:carnitine CoA-transferase CaiB-like acyl-CoA transferase